MKIDQWTPAGGGTPTVPPPTGGGGGADVVPPQVVLSTAGDAPPRAPVGVSHSSAKIPDEPSHILPLPSSNEQVTSRFASTKHCLIPWAGCDAWLKTSKPLG